MLAICTDLKNAQKVKEHLLRQQILDHRYLPIKELGKIYFPLLKKAGTKISGAEAVDTKFAFLEKPSAPKVEELLYNKLTHHELQNLPKSQEIIGNIMILEIPKELQHKEKVIAEAYLKANKHIQTVVRKEEIHSGVYRTRTVKVLAGKNTKETIHGENGVQMKVNLEQTYFSAKSAHERLRIAQLVQLGEEILVMFSGVAPYPLVLAKNSPANKIYGIEINPQAHILAQQNLELNRLGHKIQLWEGDVRKIVPTMKILFDRIIMPLPKTGEEFLDVALPKAKKAGTIHLYAFLAEEEIASEGKKILGLCKTLGYKVKLLQAVKCGQFAPRVFRVCFDLRVEKAMKIARM